MGEPPSPRPSRRPPHARAPARIAPLAARAGVPLYANDRPDLALLARCDGVHVGQDDVPVALVRKVAPGLRVGLSTHDAAQVEAALEEGPDYLAVGPVFATASKDRPSPVVGLDRARGPRRPRARGEAGAAGRRHRRHHAGDGSRRWARSPTPSR